MSYLSEKIKEIKEKIYSKWKEIDQVHDEIESIHKDPAGYLRLQIREEINELMNLTFCQSFKLRYEKRNKIAKMIDELIKTIENKKAQQ